MEQNKNQNKNQSKNEKEGTIGELKSAQSKQERELNPQSGSKSQNDGTKN